MKKFAGGRGGNRGGGGGGAAPPKTGRGGRDERSRGTAGASGRGARGAGADRRPAAGAGAPFGSRGAPVRSRPSDRTAVYADPYQPATRPQRLPRSAGPGERPRRGFTVTLDPDVARVFRGDASVNKALRLVMQLGEVVQGPAARGAPARPRGYQGSAQARGFERKPRFTDEDIAPEADFGDVEAE